MFTKSLYLLPLLKGELCLEERGHILGPETHIRQIVNKFNCSLVTMVTGFKT